MKSKSTCLHLGVAWILWFSVMMKGGTCSEAPRTTTSLDFGWRFFRNPQYDMCANNSNPFPNKLVDLQCIGLSQAQQATTVQECEQACCKLQSCSMYQWCSNSSCTPINTCWVGTSSSCEKVAGWISGQGSIDPPPPSNNTCNVAECEVDFDDSSWRLLNVPHDFVIEGTFDPAADMSHGYLPVGSAWYRLNFTIPLSAKGKAIWITFDGVYRDSYTYLNGEFIGNHPSGYTSFVWDISNSSLNFGAEGNILAIYVDATLFEGWWYEGGGIYRHTWLTITDPLHINPWGVFAPSEITGQITNVGYGQTASEALVYFNTEVINTYATLQTFVVQSTLSDPEGNQQGSTNSTATLLTQMTTSVSQSLLAYNVNLWSPDSPSLYKVTTSIIVGGVVVDSIETTIGIRKILLDIDQGLFVNDVSVKINGVCNHQDFAGVGVAVPDRINLFRVQKLKSMGINGWRASHNPPNPELLDFTDQMGILVMDENRNFANESQYYYDAGLMVKRDRNHPSIIMWSLCNENGCMEGEPAGAVVAANFKSVIKNLDPFRPVVAAMNGLWGEGLSWVLDAQGINYAYQEYPLYHNSHNYQPIFGSETASCYGARAVYITNDTACHLAIYDADECMQEWVTAVQTTPYVAGGFAWTGFDYKGEPTPYVWPDINCNYGAIDIAGFPKDTFWYYQSWYVNETVLHLFPHWNWQAGDNISVWVYSNAPYVELFVDGDSHGVQTIPYLGRAGWDVIWQTPGVIEAKAYNSAKFVITTQTIQTTGSPYALNLSLDTSDTILADGQDVALVVVSVLDANGLLVPTAANYVNFTVSSNGAIIGVGNGDPSCLEPDKATGRTTFGGLARVVVQSIRGMSGIITLVAQADGLLSTKIPIFAVYE